jgi:hypothetical protein
VNSPDPKTSPRQKWYLRRLIVNTPVQRVFVIYMLAMGLILFSLGALFVNLWQRILILRMTGQVLLNSRDYILMGAIVVIIVAGIYVGLVISNRIAGPIFRLSQEMIKLVDGQKVQPIAFRKNDYYQELAVAYNKILFRLANVEKKREKVD